MATLKQLEKDINELKTRNKRVEDDKAWEVSFTRRILLMAFTYLSVALYLSTINMDRA